MGIYASTLMSLVQPQLTFSQTCPQWYVPVHPAMSSMYSCHKAPISRQLGSVCTEVRWLCSDQSIEQWLDQLFTHSHSNWFVHQHGKGLVLADWSNQEDSSLAVFWEPIAENDGKDVNIKKAQASLRIMISRFRPLTGANVNAKTHSTSRHLHQQSR